MRTFFVVVIFFLSFGAIAHAEEIIFESGDVRIVAECSSGTCVYTDVGSGTRLTCEQAKRRAAHLREHRNALRDAGMGRHLEEINVIYREMNVMEAITNHTGCVQGPRNNNVPPRKKRGEYYAVGRW